MITDEYYEKAKNIYYSVNSDIIRQNNTESAKEKREDLIKLLAILLKELCDNEKITVNDIDDIGFGATSYVFGIGSKVIKLGTSRFSKNIPKNPYVLSPLLRRSFEFTDKRKERLFIEITERVEKVKPEEITEEDLYKLYSSLRDIGIEWVDISVNNVGRLLKDNVIHWHEDLKPDDVAISMHGNNSDITLKAGDLIIIDSDFIYQTDKTPDFTPAYEDDEWSFYKTLTKFRNRYAKEIKKKKTILIELKELINKLMPNKASKKM